jgi:signal transduction histidine kinase
MELYTQKLIPQLQKIFVDNKTFNSILSQNDQLKIQMAYLPPLIVFTLIIVMQSLYSINFKPETTSISIILIGLFTVFNFYIPYKSRLNVAPPKKEALLVAINIIIIICFFQSTGGAANNNWQLFLIYAWIMTIKHTCFFRLKAAVPIVLSAGIYLSTFFISHGFESDGPHLSVAILPVSFIAFSAIFINRLLKFLISEVQKHQTLTTILCHDISTPLNMISGDSEIIEMAKDKNSPKLDGSYRRIGSSAEKISEILEYVKLESAISSGKKKLELTDVSVKEVFHDAERATKELAKSKNIDLIFMPPAEGIKVTAHKNSLTNEILVNIISNSIKFCYSGGKITVSSKVTDVGCSISIKDNGIGIPVHILSNIYDMNYSTHRKGTEGEKGTGFGMPLVKAIVDRISGKITISSRTIEHSPDDHGTLTTIKLKSA